MLTHDRLIEFLRYNPDTGEFSRIKGVKGFAAGSKVGCVMTSGHLVICIDGANYSGSRLAWFYMHKAWPIEEIDHKDCNSLNNRFSNLREASRSQNEGNKRKYKTNTSGFKGVTAHGDRWKAQICVDGKNSHLGVFDTPEEAHAKYAKTATGMRGEFARAG